MDLKKLMCPQSIAIAGATDKPGMPGNAAQSSMQNSIAERSYFINPKRDTLFGKKCYHTLAELPEVVDCIMLCTPAGAVASYLEDAGSLGIKAAVVLASGFSEERTEEAQKMTQEIKEICEKYDIALCGPNCMGIVNIADRITVSAIGTEAVGEMFRKENGRGIALVAQSGYIISGFAVPDAEKLAYIVSAGNCTICSIEDYLCYFAEDERVTCIAAYIEGIKKPEMMERALKIAARNRKPVVILKAGMTEKGSFAAASHTGSLAGDYKTYESIFRKYGAIVVKSLQEFASTARMFAVLDNRLPEQTGVSGINFSGGENTMCADTCSRYGIDLPVFKQGTEDALREVLPSYATASNPLDATTTLFSDTGKVRALFSAISKDSGIGLITIGTDVGVVPEPKDITCVKVMGEMAGKGTLLPAVVIPSFEKPRNADIYKQFEEAGIPVLGTGELAYQAIRHLMDFVSYKPENVTMNLAFPNRKGSGKETHALSEAESKAELVPYGIHVPGQELAETEEDVDECLSRISFPVAMKIESPDILHKTDAGGVKLNICSRKEAHQAYRSIMQNCRNYKHDAQITGVMVQEMVPDGVEMIIGVKCNEQFGPLLLVGLGGVFVEIFEDAVLYPCPLGKEEAMNLLRRLKGYRLLTGYRGSKPCDIEALAEMMVNISRYAVEHKDKLKEMDLNPVTVLEQGKGVFAADALIVEYI